MQGGGYLAMTDMMPPPPGSNWKEAADEDTTICSEMSLADDELAGDEACPEQERCWFWEYHIAYHPSYQVPVIYMNGFSPGENRF